MYIYLALIGIVQNQQMMVLLSFVFHLFIYLFKFKHR